MLHESEARSASSVEERREEIRSGVVALSAHGNVRQDRAALRSEFKKAGLLVKYEEIRGRTKLLEIPIEEIQSMLEVYRADRKAASDRLEQMAAAARIEAPVAEIVIEAAAEETGVQLLESEQAPARFIEDEAEASAPIEMPEESVVVAEVVTVASIEQPAPTPSRPSIQDAVRSLAIAALASRTQNGGGGKPPSAPPKKEQPPEEMVTCTAKGCQTHQIRLVDAFVPPIFPVQQKLGIGDRDPTREELISVAGCQLASRDTSYRWFPLLEAIKAMAAKAKAESEANINKIIEGGGKIGGLFREAKIAGRTDSNAPKRQDPPKAAPQVQAPAKPRDDGRKLEGFGGLDAAFKKAREVTPGMVQSEKSGGSKSKRDRQADKAKGKKK